MSRLYFENPIQALYMMREFGVKLGIYEPNYDRKITHKIGSGFMTEIPDMFIEFSMGDIVENLHELDESELREVKKHFGFRLYVAKESEHIFEVKEQDVIIVAETDLYVVDSEYEGKDHQAISLERAKLLDSCEILMRSRNNKRFLPALVEG